MKHFVCLSAFTLLSFTLFGQAPAIEWQQTYGGPLRDYGRSLIPTFDGGYMIAGGAEGNGGDITGNHSSNHDFWLIKVNVTGGIEWQKCLGSFSDDEATVVTQTSDSGYIVAGYTETLSNSGDVTGVHGTDDIWVVKLDRLGNLQWQKALGGSNEETPTSIQQTADGGYILTGYTKSGNGDVSGHNGITTFPPFPDYDMWVAKLSSAGALQWQKCIGNMSNNYGYSIKQTADGGYMLAGTTPDMASPQGMLRDDMYLRRLDAQGNLVWHKAYGGEYFDAVYSMEPTPDGGYVLAGHSNSTNMDVTRNNGLSDCWIIKVDSAGTLLWQHSYGGFGYDGINSVKPTFDGGYIAAGESDSTGGDVTVHNGDYDFLILKLNSQGYLEWQKKIGGSREDVATSILQTADRGYLVAGYSASTNGDVIGNNGTFDVWLVKLGSAGTCPGFAASFTGTPVSCNGNGNATASITVTGGTAPFTYTWNDGFMGMSRSNIAAGNYVVTVTDAGLCQATTSMIIRNPDALGASLAVTHVACPGDSTGSATVVVTGGTAPFHYQWHDGDTSSIREDQPAANYAVTVTDAHQCTATASAAITQPQFSVSISATHVSCFGGNNGSATAIVSGGKPPYRYYWLNSVSTQTRSNLSAGTYTVQVTDSNLCYINETVVITQPTRVSGVIVGSNGCQINDGQATLTVTGGTPPYTYNWGGGVTSQNRSNLAPGTYSVTITDAHLCLDTAVVTITAPNALNTTITGTNPLCNNVGNGTASVMVSGGTSPYIYSWSTGSTSFQTGNLLAGVYTVTVTDNRQCTIVDTVTISQGTAITATVTVTDAPCFGGTGSASIAAAGGVPPYRYNWGSGMTSQNSRTNVSAGLYNVVVSDSNNCTALFSYVVSQPSMLTLSMDITHDNCVGDSVGAIAVTVAGGTTPYTYNWGGGILTQNRSNLASGMFRVTVTDAHQCTVAQTVTLDKAGVLPVNVTIDHASCHGGTGTITLQPSGGSGSYFYHWSSGLNLPSISGPADAYEVVVQSGQCTDTLVIFITEPPVLYAMMATTDVNCFNGADGTASVTGTGGTPPYTYAWSDGAVGANRTALTAGVYTAVVTDSNQCTATWSLTVHEPAEIVVSAAIGNVTCFGDADGTIRLAVTAGNPPYTYIWSDGPVTANRNNLEGGTYTVTVHDANGCSAQETALVSEPSAFSLSGQIVHATGGADNGSITLSAAGGIPPYTYDWSNGGSTGDITDLTEGIYAVTVEDANGCSAVDSFMVDNEPSGIADNIIQKVVLDIYPNPAVNTTTISMQVQGMADVRLYVYSSDGNVKYIHAETFAKEEQVDVNMEDWPAGIYMVRIIINGEMFTRKLALIR